MGASRPPPNYPLSLKVCPKLFSIGQASWQAGQARPYLRANAACRHSAAPGQRRLPKQTTASRLFWKLHFPCSLRRATQRSLARTTQSFLRNKFVTNSVDGLNERRMIRIVLDFLSQFRDAVVHGAITGALLFWPDGTDKLLSGQDDPRSGNQEFEQLELLKRQGNRLVRTTQLHFLEVETELSEFGRLAGSAWPDLGHNKKACCGLTNLSNNLSSLCHPTCHRTVTLLLKQCLGKITDRTRRFVRNEIEHG
jgi:hypothetical protein